MLAQEQREGDPHLLFDETVADIPSLAFSSAAASAAMAANQLNPGSASGAPVPASAIEPIPARRYRYVGALSVSLALHGILFLFALQEARTSSAVATPPVRITLLTTPAAARKAASSSADTSQGQANQVRQWQKPVLTTATELKERTSRPANTSKSKAPRTAPSVSRSATQPRPKLPSQSQQPAIVFAPLTPPPTSAALSEDKETILGEEVQGERGAVENSQQAKAANGNAVGDGRVGHGFAERGTDPFPVTAVAYPPQLVFQVKAEYPARARNLGVEGLVRLKAILDREGRIERDVQVLQSVPLLDEAAISSVQRWRFTPARNNSGQPVRVFLEIPMKFELRW